MMKAIMYMNGDLTQGTRIYNQQGGQRFDVSNISSALYISMHIH